MCFSLMQEGYKAVGELHQKLMPWTETPFVGAVPAAGMVVLGGIKVVVGVVHAFFALFYSLYKWNASTLKQGGKNIGLAIFDIVQGSALAIPAVSLLTKEGNTTKNLAQLNKGEWSDFNPLWICKALGKVVLGVFFLVGSIFLFLNALCCKEKGCEKFGNTGKAAITMVFIGVLETIPFVKIGETK